MHLFMQLLPFSFINYFLNTFFALCVCARWGNFSICSGTLRCYQKDEDMGAN